MTIGQRIAELRKRAGLSQEALGEELGVSRQAISKWESDAALPDVDKLIGLARKFNVTVGWLLGVEELPAPAQPQESGGADTETAEVLEQYLAKLTQPQKLPPKRKKQLIAAGIAAAACLVFLTARVVNLQSELSGVRNTVNNLSNQLSYVQNSVANIDTNITDRVQNALNEEYGLLTNYDLKLVDVDYQANTARLLFTGVLRETPADPNALSFYLLRGDGTCVYADEQSWDAASGTYTGKITAPLEDGLSYYFSTGDKRTTLNTYSFADLEACTKIRLDVDLNCGFTTAGGTARSANGFVSVMTNSDMIGWAMDEQWSDWVPRDVTEQRAWIVMSGLDGDELSRQELTLERTDGNDEVTAGGLACNEYTWETPQADISMDGITEGTTIWAEAEMAFDNGQTTRRTRSSSGYRWTGSDWETVFYNDTAQQYQR